MDCAIELTDVRKSFSRANPALPAGEVLRGVSLKVAAGEFVSIMGPSGSGKSTLLNLIGALDRPSAGRVSVFGTALDALGRNARADMRNRLVGFVFQGFHLLPRLPVWRSVALPLVYAGVPTRERVARATACLNRVGLAGFEKHLPEELSGGQQQRVALARALVNGPKLLLADEPTGSLDQQTGREALGVLRGLNCEGLTILLVTHDPECARLAQRTVLMRDGAIEGEQRWST